MEELFSLASQPGKQAQASPSVSYCTTMPLLGTRTQIPEMLTLCPTNSHGVSLLSQQTSSACSSLRGGPPHTDLQRGDLQDILHQGGCVEDDGLGDEGGLDGPRVEQVGVVAHLAELHQDVDH